MNRRLRSSEEEGSDGGYYPGLLRAEACALPGFLRSSSRWDDRQQTLLHAPRRSSIVAFAN